MDGASDVDWFKFSYDPQRSGSGDFYYSLPVNNDPMPRTANIVVEVGGVGILHSISQEPPSSCSYVVSPERADIPASGGTGAFDVITTACRLSVERCQRHVVRRSASHRGDERRGRRQGDVRR